MAQENNIEEKHTIKANLKVFFPIIFELLRESNIDWNTVQELFTNKFNQYKERQSRFVEPIQIEASIYSVISGAIKNDREAILLYSFLKKLFEELADNLNENEKCLIKDTIFGVLTNVDNKYLNFVGELMVLNHFKKRMPLDLIDVEVPLNLNNPKGKKIDFKFLDKQANIVYFIEVVNIRLDKINTANEQNIERLLSQKLKEKILKKGKSDHFKYYLIPVLWGQWDEIKAVTNYYIKSKFQIDDMSVPICFIPFTDADDKIVHRTGSIDTMFENTTVTVK